eukprot:461588-Pleurochrysis_carterae.AAC.1
MTQLPEVFLFCVSRGILGCLVRAAYTLQRRGHIARTKLPLGIDADPLPPKTVRVARVAIAILIAIQRHPKGEWRVN